MNFLRFCFLGLFTFARAGSPPNHHWQHQLHQEQSQWGANDIQASSHDASQQLPDWMAFHLGQSSSGSNYIPNSYAGPSYSPAYVYEPSQPTVYAHMPDYTSHQMSTVSEQTGGLEVQQQQRASAGPRRPPRRSKPSVQQSATYSTLGGYDDIMNSILSRPHLEDQHITGVSETTVDEEEDGDDSDEENEEAGWQKEGEEEEDVRSRLRSPPRPKLSRKQMIALFEQAWASMGLSLRMPAGELAAELTEMKIRLGYSRNIGALASNKVTAGTNPRYIELFRLYTRRYSQKLVRLRGRYRRNRLIKTVAQRDHLLLLNFRNIIPKDYNHMNESKWPNVIRQAIQSDRRMGYVWKRFMRERVIPRAEGAEDDGNTDEDEGEGDDAIIDPDNLTVKQIERLSRDLDVDPYGRRVTTEFIKAYIQRGLHMSQGDIDEFTIRRCFWRDRQRNSMEKLKRQRQKERRSSDDIDAELRRIQEEEDFEEYDDVNA